MQLRSMIYLYDPCVVFDVFIEFKIIEFDWLNFPKQKVGTSEFER